METRANYALIGLFTLVVIAGAFLFVFWFSGTDSSQRRQPFRIVFVGSVGGLAKGSGVQFNGIRVGEVTDIRLMPEDPRRVEAVVEVDRTTPVRSDTRARLEASILTQIPAIALIGGDPGSPALSAGPGQPLPTIFADPSGVGDLIESARNIARQADEVLGRVNKLVSDNEGGIGRTVRNIETFSQALSDNAPNVDRFMSRVGEAAEKFGPVAGRIETLATDLSELVRAVDRQRVARAVENIEGFTQTLADNRENVSTVLGNVAELTKRLQETSAKLDTALADASALIRSVDGAKLGRTVDNVESVTSTIAANRENIDGILRDGASLTARLNNSSTKLDSALDDVGKLVRSVDAESLNRTLSYLEGFALTLTQNRENVSDILKNVSAIAKAVDPEKLNSTVANVDKFAASLGKASPDVEATVREARSLTEKLNKSADRVDGVLKAAENFLGTAAGDEGKSTFGEIREAARSIRVLADNLDKRTADITTGLNRFTGSGLREVEALTSEGRRTLNSIDRTVRSLERNPQQLIFGGKPNIPEYNGRR